MFDRVSYYQGNGYVVVHRRPWTTDATPTTGWMTREAAEDLCRSLGVDPSVFWPRPTAAELSEQMRTPLEAIKPMRDARLPSLRFAAHGRMLLLRATPPPIPRAPREMVEGAPLRAERATHSRLGRRRVRRRWRRTKAMARSGRCR